MPRISIVVPVLDDEAAAERLLSQLPADPETELVLVDGADSATLQALVDAHSGARLVHTTPGRGQQMDAGAATSSSAWIWFLHADSRVPAGWRTVFDNAGPDARGGWFRFALDSPAWQARVLERLVALRVAVCRLPYGDQGFFVRREVFTQLGGFGPLPLMEDVAFARRLIRGGSILEPRLALETSARRWQRDGWVRRSLRNVSILALYGLGVSPARLARWYGRH
jgi:rSAM/selenodomain-associated transferase 2